MYLLDCAVVIFNGPIYVGVDVFDGVGSQTTCETKGGRREGKRNVVYLRDIPWDLDGC